MTILKNITYIDPYTFDFKRGNIAIEKGLDKKFEFVDLIPENSEIVDCTGLFATKSFVVAHHHAYSALATGMPAPAKNPQNFSEILKYVWWNLDKKLDKETIKASALVTAMKAAKSGSTFIIDHHASPFYIENSLQIIAEAFEKVGVSHLLCYEISDRDGIDIANKGLSETESFLKINQGLVGLHASFTVGNNTLKKSADLVQKYNSGIHIHLAEDKVDQVHCEKNYNCRIVERLNNYGVLNSSKSIVAHAIHINDNERRVLKKSATYIVQNPESNLNNQVGFFNRNNLDENKLILGTDGMHSNMIRSAQVAYFSGKMYDSPGLDKIYNQLRNNHTYLKQNNFVGDGDNNLVVFDYNYHTDFNKNNFLGHFFYSLTSESIKHVISDGKFIVKDKSLVKINEKEIIDFAREQTKRLWKLL